MNTIKKILAAGVVLGAMVGAAQAQVTSFSTPPQGSVWNTMASVIAGQVRETAGMQMVVQPYGGNAQMMQAVNDQLAEFSLNDVNDAITAVSGTGEYSASMPNLLLLHA